MDLTNPGMSFGVRPFHVSQTSVHNPWKKMTPMQKKTKTNQNQNPQVPIPSEGGRLHRLGALMCLTAAVKQELAPTKSWQKTFTGIHLSCQSSAQRFPLPLPRDTRARWGTQPGQSRELAYQVPAIQTEIIFFSKISIKSVTCFFLFAIAFYIKNRPLNGVTGLVNSLQHLRNDKV